MNKLVLILLFTLLTIAIEYYAYQLYKILFVDYSENAQKIAKWIYFGFGLISLIGFYIYHLVHPDFIGRHTRTFILSGVVINTLAKLLMMIFALFDDALRAVRWIIKRLSNPEQLQAEGGISRSEFLAKTGLIVAAAPIVTLSWGIISGAHDYRIRRITLPIPGLPKALSGIRIAQLSDIHSGSFWNKTAVEGGVQMLMDEKPDIALFTGDLVNNRASEMQDWGNIFAKVKAPLGTYSVFGNHDYGDYVSWESQAAKAKNLRGLATIHKNMGWQLLMNEHRIINVDGEQLAILGIENWSAKGRFPKYGQLNEAAKGLNTDLTSILLSHDPSHWQAEVLPSYPHIDLTLSGHTHGMQYGVEIPGFKWSPVQYVYKEWAGLYKANQQYLYVNRGFGYIGYPGRFGILPEVTLLTLETA